MGTDCLLCFVQLKLWHLLLFRLLPLFLRQDLSVVTENVYLFVTDAPFFEPSSTGWSNLDQIPDEMQPSTIEMKSLLQDLYCEPVFASLSVTLFQ